MFELAPQMAFPYITISTPMMMVLFVTVMAFWFAWRNLQESAPRFKSSNYLRGPHSAWSTLGRRRRVIQNPYYKQKEPNVAA